MADQNILIKFSADTTDLKRGTAEANAAMKDVKGAVDATSSAMSNYNTKVGTATASTIELEKRLKFLNNGLQEEAYEIKNGEIVLKQKTAATVQNTVATAANTAATTTATTATRVFTIATNLAKAAINGLKLALTGGLAIAITLIAQNWDKFGSKLEKRFPLLGKIAAKVRELGGAFTDWAGITSELEREITKLNEALDKQNDSLKLDAKYYKEVEGNAKKVLDVEKQILLNKQQKIINDGKLNELTADQILQLKDIAIELQILDKEYLELNKTQKETVKVTEELKAAIDPKRLNQWERAIATVYRQMNATKEETESLIERINRLRAALDSVQGGGVGDTVNPITGKTRTQEEKDRQDRANDIDQEKQYLGYLTDTLQLVSQIVSLIASARQARIQAQISDLERLRDAELQNAELTARQKEKIEERYQKQIAKLKTQQAVAQRRADITQAVINTALAITQALGNPFRIALVAALGAAQIAIIARQPIPKFRKGGEITGKRHESGGVHIEAEGGEYIMRREAVDKYGKDFMKKVNNLALPQSIAAPVLTPNVINLMGNKGIDHEKLGVTISRELAKQPKVMIQMDQNGFTKSIQQGVKTTYYANRKFRAS